MKYAEIIRILRAAHREDIECNVEEAVEQEADALLEQTRRFTRPRPNITLARRKEARAEARGSLERLVAEWLGRHPPTITPRDVLSYRPIRSIAWAVATELLLIGIQSPAPGSER